MAVGDAKYVELDRGWLNGNVYQMLAYCVALGLPRGLLIYASQRPLEVQHVQRSGTELEIMGIDMSGFSAELVEGARAVARRLLAHAEGGWRITIGTQPTCDDLLG